MAHPTDAAEGHDNTQRAWPKAITRQGQVPTEEKSTQGPEPDAEENRQFLDQRQERPRD